MAREKFTEKMIASLKPREARYEVYDVEVRGLVIVVQVSGTKTFFLRYATQQGQRQRLKLGQWPGCNVVRARTLAQEALGLVAQKGDPQGQKQSERKAQQAQLTLREYLEQVYGPWASKRFKTGSYQVHRILRYYSPVILDTNLDALTRDQIERYHTTRLSEGNTIATCNRNGSALKAALQRAVEWDRLPANPLAMLKSTTEKGRERCRFLSDEEEHRLFAALEAREEERRLRRDSYNAWASERAYPLRPDLRLVPYTDFFPVIVRTALWTGLRRGELFNLKWEDVDLGERLINVQATSTKTSLPREIPMPNRLYAVLVKWQEQHRDAPKDGYVFTDNGSRLVDVKKSWQALCQRADIQGLRFHDLRHSYASRLVQRGVDLYIVARLLGHASVQTTERHYAHLRRSDLERAARMIDMDPQDNLVQFPGQAQNVE